MLGVFTKKKSRSRGCFARRGRHKGRVTAESCRNEAGKISPVGLLDGHNWAGKTTGNTETRKPNTPRAAARSERQGMAVVLVSGPGSDKGRPRAITAALYDFER